MLSTSDALTLIVGAAGVAVSVLASIIAYRLGERASAEHRQDMLAEIGRLKSVLTGIGMRAPETVSASGVRARPTENESLEVAILAAIGALLNESGEVDVARLVGQVGTSMGAPRRIDVVAALGALKRDGIVGWDGPADLLGVDRIRVPANHSIGRWAR